MELTTGEKFFIEVVREFDFLRRFEYNGNEFNIIGKEYFVKFKNSKLSRSIIIENSEPGELNVLIERKTFFGHEIINIKELYTKAGIPKSVKNFAELMQSEFINIIKGKNRILIK